MQPNNTTTTAFYTLDGCHATLVSDVFQSLLSWNQNSHQEWSGVIEHPRIQERLRSQGIDQFDSRNDIQWDDPTLLFTLTRMLDSDSIPMMLGEDKNRERFGRFPHSTGSALRYIRENVRQVGPQSNEMYDDLVMHLDYLLTRCDVDHVGDGRFMEGQAGLNIMGFLSGDEVKILRTSLLGGGWTVARDEPIDGGVRDAIRHLSPLLLAAERNNAGLIHRKHD
ncbi:MAG: hypothetical protein CMB70_05550 [Euryarchaeota archaeon]|nr:hypothetical protein [Euryarchaeota archaeon]|tara:strand:+ start:9998 stop:10666 length:669 start_codon:yes stop_codon:yes gene_type:complete